MKRNNFVKLIIAIGICELAGVIGSVFTVSSIPTWYEGLIKPMFNPPNWVFSPAWITLYALMGISVYLVWQKLTENKTTKRALWLFWIQLFLNAIWSIIFFGLKNPGWAFADIILLWFAIFVTIVAFSKISKLATLLLIPYILWVSFAGYLNYSIWTLNQTEPVVCAMDAKECLDGSYVGRVAPNCDFAACPKESLIRIENLRANEQISSPLIVKGSARGFWFFEADFPIKLFDENGSLLTVAIAQAQGEWMTEDFVPFSAELNFESPKTKKGTLVLEKDNPSGLIENADELKIPIIFSAR